MQIAVSKTRDKFPLSLKKIIKKTLAGVIVWFVLLGGVAVAGRIVMFSNDLGSLAFYLVIFCVVLFFIIWVGSYFYQKWYYSVYFYDLTDNYVVIRKGPITPTEITIPYERLQDVYVDQDLFDRFFGLYDVHLSSATVSSGIEAHIDGVEKAAADGLKTMLLETIQHKIGKKPTFINGTN